MRDDFLEKVIEFSHFVLERSVSLVATYVSATEVFVHQVQDFASVKVLTYAKAWLYLPSDEELRSFRKRYRETSFAIYITREIIR